jgi:hypothetical protein
MQAAGRELQVVLGRFMERQGQAVLGQLVTMPLQIQDQVAVQMIQAAHQMADQELLL